MTGSGVVAGSTPGGGAGVAMNTFIAIALAVSARRARREIEWPL